MEFIPVNEDIAKKFEEELAKSPLHRSTDNFIAIYNNGLINKSNSEIDKVAKKVTEVYKNISLTNRTFIVKSKEEVIAEEFEVLFPHIAFVATLKRVAKDILQDNYPEDTKMVFAGDDKNLVQVYDPSTEEIRPYEGAERIRNAHESIATNPFIIEEVNLEHWGDDAEDVVFKAMDIIQLDTSFIENIGNLLYDYIEN